MKAEEEIKQLQARNSQLMEDKTKTLEEGKRVAEVSENRQGALDQIRDAVLPIRRALSLLNGNTWR